MDGIHDLGGLAGFGPVDREPEEPVFHEQWEGRVFGLAAALMLGGHLRTPQFRHAIERMDPGHYLASSYYEHWLTACAAVCVEGGLIEQADLVADGPFPLSRPVAADPVPAVLAQPTSTQQRFHVGDRVRVRNVHPLGHTRCPDYVRDRHGEVVRVDPDSPVPELEAHRDERVPEPTYCVRFRADELWGDDADESSKNFVYIDLYERYLEASGR